MRAEKRQILNLVFQNLQLDDQKNLILEVKEPFMTLMRVKNGSIRPIDCRQSDSRKQVRRFALRRNAEVLTSRPLGANALAPSHRQKIKKASF